MMDLLNGGDADVSIDIRHNNNNSDRTTNNDNNENEENKLPLSTIFFYIVSFSCGYVGWMGLDPQIIFHGNFIPWLIALSVVFSVLAVLSVADYSTHQKHMFDEKRWIASTCMWITLALAIGLSYVTWVNYTGVVYVTALVTFLFHWTAIAFYLMSYTSHLTSYTSPFFAKKIATFLKDL